MQKRLFVADAEVSFELLNYAELVAISRKKTDANGKVVLRTGKGSLFVSVWKEERHVTAILDTREISAQTLVLAGKKAEKSAEEWVAFDMIAPSDAPVNTKRPTEEQKQTGAQKFRQSTEKRLAKVNSFFGEEIWNWICKNIQEEPAYEYEELLTTPAGTLRYQRASLESKKVLFVAICRTLGVPARLNPLDGEMQYYGENAFLNVENSEKTEEVCEKTAQIHLESGDDTRWVYMQNWTIAKKSETGYLWQTLQLGEKTEEVCEKTAQIHLESGDDTRWVYMQNWTIAKKSETGYLWQTLQLGEGYQGEAKLEVEAGTYRVITTNRLPNGNQFAACTEFDWNPGTIRDGSICRTGRLRKNQRQVISGRPCSLGKDIRERQNWKWKRGHTV